MSELYTTPDVQKAFEAGRRAAEYALSESYGPLDIHTVDAGLTALAQANVLTREHKDPVFGPKSVAVVSATEAKSVAQEIIALCDTPRTMTADEAGISPEMILALVQLAGLVRKLFGW